MVKVCSVRWCKNSTRGVSRGRVLSSVSFFPYPQHEDTCSKWKTFANNWMPLVGWEPTKYSYICSDHFSSEDMIWEGGSCHVREMAVPGNITLCIQLKYSLSKSDPLYLALQTIMRRCNILSH